MKSNLRLMHPIFLKVCLIVGCAVLWASLATAQVTGYAIISTSPTPIIPNTAGSITVRQTGDPTVNSGRLYCGNSLSQSPYPTVVNGSMITLTQRSLPMPPPVLGTEFFCDVSYTLPPLSSSVYIVKLDLGTFGIGGMPERSYAIVDLGTLCVGTCTAQQVPLNFYAGAPLWWLAIASLFGLGGYAVRRLGLNGKK
jgi:hypothetical protein